MDNNYNFPVELQPIYLTDGRLIQNKKAVVRTDSMNTLGIVSDGYGLIKHATVIDSFRDAGSEYNVQEKISLTKNGAYLFYQMTFPKIEAEIRKGDIIKMMMIAKNSYNGGNSLQVIFGAFRLVCENGMVLGTKFLSFNFRHIGEVGGVNDGSIRNAYTDYIKMFGDKMPMITEMSRRQMNGDAVFDEDKIALPRYLLETAQGTYETQNDHTVWGYYNALTYAISHDMRSENPNLAIKYGFEAWKAAEIVMN
jgi:hypothetical protein